MHTRRGRKKDGGRRGEGGGVDDHNMSENDQLLLTPDCSTALILHPLFPGDEQRYISGIRVED